MKENDPDVELLARIGNDESAAVNEMVARKLPHLLALAYRVLGDTDEAKDVAQESFLRIWKHAAGWRTGEARFDTWLQRVALNLCRDALRRRKKLSLIPVEEAIEALSCAPPPEEHLESFKRSKQVDMALAALPDQQREAIVLQYYQGLSNIEAARLMNVSVAALESLLARARRNLRSHLAETLGDGSGRG